MPLSLGVERNRKARILVCSETYWMSSGCHILMFNWSFFSAEIFHWRHFVCFCSFARLHFRKFCIIWNRCREEASQYRHHQNFSPTSIHWIQKCECLLHEFEYQIMLSVSVFVSWNSTAGSEITIWMDIQYYWQFLQLKPDIINDLCQSMVQFKWQSNCRQFKWGWTVTILFQTDWTQTNGEVKKKISFESGFTATVIIEMDGNKQMVKNETLLRHQVLPM